MRKALLVTAAISLLSAPACTMTRSGRTSTIAAGVATMMAGAVMSTHPDLVKEALANDDEFTPWHAGMLLTMAGATIAAVGLRSSVREEAPSSCVPPPAPTAYVPTSYTPPSMTMSFSASVAPL